MNSKKNKKRVILGSHACGDAIVMQWWWLC